MLAPEQTSLLAKKLEWLFANKTRSDGTPYTQAEVVEGTGGALSRVYLWKLRTGQATRPSFRIIQALATFFQVDAGFFFEETVGETGYQDLAFPRGRHVGAIADRASKLDERGRRIILDLMDYILEKQAS